MRRQESIAFSENGLQKIQAQIEILRHDLGASGAMLLDQSGRLLVECGQHGDFDINVFLALLGSAMFAANAVVHLLHDESAFDLHFHEGQNYQMYSSRINDQVFLTMIFERHAGTSRVGMVWLNLRRSITELRALVNRATIKPGTSEDKEIQSAISVSLGETLNLLEGDMLAPNPPSDSTNQAPGLSKPAPPDASLLDVSDDPNRTISYDEARRLGLVNLDEPDGKS